MSTGKIAYVTGGMGGIGTSICRKLHDSGHKVIAGCGPNRDFEKWLVNQKKDGYTFFPSVGNVADWKSTESAFMKVFDEHGAPSILVNNAGITKDNILLRMKDEEWLDVMDTNLNAIYRLSKACLRGMTKARWGRIITIGSVVGSTGNPGQTNYSATKAGVLGFTKSLARELGPRNITVNCVSPGFIDTDMTKKLPDASREALLTSVPLGRFGSPAEVAEVVNFLVGDTGAYITGENIHVNGGMYMP